MPLIPRTNQPAYLLISLGTGQNDSQWVPFTDAKDYAVSGTLGVTSGATNYIPGFIYANEGQLISVTGLVRAGSLTADIDLNGSAITGLTSLAIGTTASTYTPTNTTLISPGDVLKPVIDSVSSADNLTLSFVFWVYL